MKNERERGREKQRKISLSYKITDNTVLTLLHTPTFHLCKLSQNNKTNIKNYETNRNYRRQTTRISLINYIGRIIPFYFFVSRFVSLFWSDLFFKENINYFLINGKNTFQSVQKHCYNECRMCFFTSPYFYYLSTFVKTLFRNENLSQLQV